MLRRTPLNREGPTGRANREANQRLKEIFSSERITSCEVRLAGCLRTWALTFAHRHKRLWYRGDVDKLSNFNQVILACTKCHETIEHNKQLTEEIFQKLRGDE